MTLFVQTRTYVDKVANYLNELIGKVVEIKFFEVTQNQKDATKYSLRFPTWQGRIRNDKGVEDITDVTTV